MQNGHPTYTKAFKVEAVKLVETSGKSKSQIAQDLGISDSSLSRWCQEYGEHGEQAFPGSGHQLPEQEEVRQLKRELEVVRMERDILKRAMLLRSTTANEQRYTSR
jgi:transposase